MAHIKALARDKIARRQNGGEVVELNVVRMDVPDTDDDGRPPECFGKPRPALPPGLVEPDPEVCGRELAFLRQMIAKYRDEPYPVKVLLTLKMLMAIIHLRGPNRDTSSAWVRRYVAMVERKSWMKTHQHFAFDLNGLLRDGLHRALAFYQSEGERHGWIWFGCDPKSFAAMDNGRRRSAAENLGIHGDKHGALTTAVVRLRYRNEHQGQMPDDMLINETGYDLIHDTLFDEAIALSLPLFTKTKTPRSSGALAYWLIGEQSTRASRLSTFWSHLIKGADLPEDSPIYVCRERLRLMAVKASFRHKQYLSQTAMAAWIIECWNLWTHDNPVPSQKWPLWDKPHGLPPVDADDAYGSGEGRRVIKVRENAQSNYKGRRRTPANVVRALGIPR